MVPNYEGMPLLEFVQKTNTNYPFSVAEADRCKLSCKSSSDIKYIFIAAEVRDGTTCDRDTNDRCLLGKCVVRPKQEFNHRCTV